MEYGSLINRFVPSATTSLMYQCLSQPGVVGADLWRTVGGVRAAVAEQLSSRRLRWLQCSRWPCRRRQRGASGTTAAVVRLYTARHWADTQRQSHARPSHYSQRHGDFWPTRRCHGIWSRPYPVQAAREEVLRQDTGGHCLVMLTYLMFFLHMVTGSAWHVCCEIG